MMLSSKETKYIEERFPFEIASPPAHRFGASATSVGTLPKRLRASNSKDMEKGFASFSATDGRKKYIVYHRQDRIPTEFNVEASIDCPFYVQPDEESLRIHFEEEPESDFDIRYWVMKY